MTKLERLAAACKCSVIIEANPHRDNYETPREHFERMEAYDEAEEGPPPEEMAAIEAGATLWWLQWYPRTPNGFNRLFGSNLERMLDDALEDMADTDAFHAHLKTSGTDPGGPGPEGLTLIATSGEEVLP